MNTKYNQKQILEAYKKEVAANFTEEQKKKKQRVYAIMFFDTEINLNISSHPTKWANYKNQFFDNGLDAFIAYANDLDASTQLVESDNIDQLPTLMRDTCNNMNNPSWQNEYLFPYL